MVSDTMVLELSKDIAWQELGGKVVVVTPRTKNIHIFHGTGSAIWKSIDGARDARAISQAVCEEFEVEPGRAAEDTREFLAELLDKGIVEVRNGDS